MVALRVKADIKKATRYLNSVQRKQVPFATAKALTLTAKDAQVNITKTLPKDLHKPTPFTMRGIGMRPAKKKFLQSSVFVKPIQFDYLKWSIHGGTRHPKHRVIIIGAEGRRRNQYGNTPGFRHLRRNLLAKPNVFEGEINGQAGIWQRKKRSRRNPAGSVTPLAIYVDRAGYSKRLRFFERAEGTARARFPTHFRRELQKALRTAR